MYIWANTLYTSRRDRNIDCMRGWLTASGRVSLRRTLACDDDALLEAIESDDNARGWFVFDDDRMDDDDKLEALACLRQELVDELLSGAEAELDTSEDWMVDDWYEVYQVTFPELDDATVTVCYGVKESNRVQVEALNGDRSGYVTCWYPWDSIDCWASGEIVDAIRAKILSVADVQEAVFKAVAQVAE